MPIQNISNPVQVSQSASGGARNAVVVAPSKHAAGDMPPELPQAAAKQATEQQQLSSVQIKNVVDNINKALKQSARNLEFTVDTDTEKPVVKVVDTETGDVIRQIPSEEMLSITRAIDEAQVNLLLKQTA
ncbi:MAG: flagellar protein FlaG [Gallionellaceae bacterium]|nr:MAG: flagellar protein FlaG [Gallionellaceae bacterium]